MLEYPGDKNKNNVTDPEEIGIKHLKGDGDFRSDESVDLLKQADIVVTNPPFSLFREYVSQLVARVDWIHWIVSAKQAQTRAKRISDACEMLASGERRVCCFDPSGFYSKAFGAPKAKG